MFISTTTNEMETNLDGEIDPQVRIDTMLDQCARLDPPAVGFSTRGHILGFEPTCVCTRTSPTVHTCMYIYMHNNNNKDLFLPTCTILSNGTTVKAMVHMFLIVTFLFLFHSCKCCI